MHSKILDNKRRCNSSYTNPDSKVHGANMGPTYGRQEPGGPHAGPMNFAVWVKILLNHK